MEEAPHVHEEEEEEEERAWIPYESLLPEKTEAVVTEKIDGSNASIMASDGKLRYFSRNVEVTLGGKFHGFQYMFPDLVVEDDVTIFGEVFGGYDGMESKSAVMKRVAYGLAKRFVVFDVRYASGHYMTFKKLRGFCASHGLECVAVAFQGPVSEAFTFCAEHANSHRSAYADPHAFAPAGCELAEGFVVRLGEDLRIKHRRDAFVERPLPPKAKGIPPQERDKARDRARDRDPARLANAKSKLLEGATEEEVVAEYEKELELV